MEIVLNTYGTSISRDNDHFLVSYLDGKQTIPINGITSIIIGKGALITSDAVILAVENEIEILFVDRSGKPMGRVWSPKYGSVSTIRKGQLNFSFSKDSIEWIKNIIIEKIENQQALILALCNTEDKQAKINSSVRRLIDYSKKVKQLSGEVVSDIAATLRGWEGVSSKIYFGTLNQFIPEQYRFEKRTQHPATDIVNALLNYGYGVLYSKIEGALIKTGIDPYIGVFHRDDYNRPVLVFDIIEKYRIWVDYVVYSLVQQNIINDEFFSVKDDGSYWLEALGRRILIQSLNDYLEENITIKEITRSRNHFIFLYCQDLAQQFKKY